MSGGEGDGRELCTTVRSGVEVSNHLPPFGRVRGAGMPSSGTAIPCWCPKGSPTDGRGSISSHAVFSVLICCAALSRVHKMQCIYPQNVNNGYCREQVNFFVNAIQREHQPETRLYNNNISGCSSYHKKPTAITEFPRNRGRFMQHSANTQLCTQGMAKGLDCMWHHHFNAFTPPWLCCSSNLLRVCTFTHGHKRYV